jgi:lysozyme family protein
MVAKNQKQALAKVLVHEGGYVNHPKDPGGATNQGVIQRTYDAYRKGKKLPIRSVKQMTPAERDDIYDRQYWDAVKADQLPAGVDYVVFDGAVNSGPMQSIKWLQRALQPVYTGQIDGVMGLATLAALNATNNHDALVDRICDRRLAFLKALRTWGTFGRGWKSRVDGVRAVGKAWANGSEAVSFGFVEGGQAKGTVEDARKAPGKGLSDAATGGGVGAGGIAGAVQGLQEQLTPFSAAGDWITNVVVILAVTGAVLTIGGLAYRWYAKRREAEINDALDLVTA